MNVEEFKPQCVHIVVVFRFERKLIMNPIQKSKSIKAGVRKVFQIGKKYLRYGWDGAYAELREAHGYIVLVKNRRRQR